MFFEETTPGTITLPRCQDCQARHWYPMERCPRCRSARLEWAPIPAAGTVFTVTTVRHAFTPATKGQVPYGIALVSLDDAPEVRIVCRADAKQALSIGDGVTVRVEPGGDGSGTVWCDPVR